MVVSFTSADSAIFFVVVPFIPKIAAKCSVALIILSFELIFFSSVYKQVLTCFFILAKKYHLFKLIFINVTFHIQLYPINIVITS